MRRRYFGSSAAKSGCGRAITSALYFVAGLALVFGILSMFALPLQQAVLGTCPAPPQPCSGGLQRPLTVAENTGMGFGAGFAIASIFVGFFGLFVLYRRRSLPTPAPPVRKIPPVAAPPDPPVRLDFGAAVIVQCGALSFGPRLACLL